MSVRPLIVCLAALPLLTSCVMQGEMDAVNRRLSQNEQRMQQLASQVGSVEQVLPGQAEMWAQMQSMRQELNAVRGQLDEANAGGGLGARSQAGQLALRVDRLEMAVRQMASELGVSVEALNAPLEGAAAADPQVAPGTATSVATPPAAAANAKPTDTATNLYDSGMNAFAARNYNGAIKAFGDFTKSFPTNKLVSNAYFWQGESYYQMKDYAKAALTYNTVIEKYPGSAKFQGAMLKQGMALYMLNKKDAGKERLNELIKKYPTSPEAGSAKRFLQQNK